MNIASRASSTVRDRCSASAARPTPPTSFAPKCAFAAARGISVAAVRAFANRILEPLRAYDEKHQTELVRTLRLFFDVGQNVKTAAAELFVHRHTVVYRLRQIAEISGYALSSAHDQLTLRTAMAIDALGADDT